MLISMGKSIDDNPEPPKTLTDSLAPHWRINMVSEVIRSQIRFFADIELMLLLKGLVYAERELDGWWFGSVAPLALNVMHLEDKGD